MGLSYYEDDTTGVEATLDDDEGTKSDPDWLVGAVCALAMAAWVVSGFVAMVVEGMSK